GKDGLLHISEISWDRIDTMESTGIKEGDVVTVKLIEIDKKTGKFRLSMKALQEKPEGYVERERAPRNNDRRGDRGGDRRNNDRRGGDRRNNNGGDRGPRNPRYNNNNNNNANTDGNAE
ncbi:MAG: S1 RNA-binding domain-containing protein, partial [Muribaculaceae bacterium]|nr:S1 RNA-binding domain-containing protein [Muribaculaceae bacterium]